MFQMTYFISFLWIVLTAALAAVCGATNCCKNKQVGNYRYTFKRVRFSKGKRALKLEIIRA